jgi:hypothetical protein
MSKEREIESLRCVCFGEAAVPVIEDQDGNHHPLN